VPPELRRREGESPLGVRIIQHVPHAYKRFLSLIRTL
jgi:hypothetical protein